VAKEGFVGLGIDLLSRDGGTMAFNTPQDATAAINKLTDEQMIGDVTAGVAYLKGSSVNAPKVGIVGFCFGGRVVLISALKAKGLDAAVAFYGPPAGSNDPAKINPTAQAASLTCPLMGNYGALDPAIPVAAVQAFQQAAQASGQPLDFKIFDNAGHAFNNDTRPFSNGLGYVPSAATEAWGRTLTWFRKYLG
jgi:carboxymethylenebutenolidase